MERHRSELAAFTEPTPPPTPQPTAQPTPAQTPTPAPTPRPATPPPAPVAAGSLSDAELRTLSRNRPACGSGWWSENTGKVWNNDVSVLHREFMAEPWAPINHRTNIMDASFTRVGIGAVQGPDAMYLTVVFCR